MTWRAGLAVGSSSRSPWGRRIAWVWMVAAGIGALVLLLLIVFPSLFGKDFNPDALVAFVLVAATLAYAILTYLLLSASERQVATLETQIEEERATRRSQEAQAALADEKSQALIEEERATRESREREAAEAREASKVLLDESRRARRDDHAPYVAVSITRSNRGTEQRKNDTWIEAEMPPHLMKDDFSDWRAWVFIEFTVHNDGPGSVVVDISPSFSPGELGWPVDDSTTGEERRTRTKLLPAGGQARIFWRMVAPAEFWWYRARKQVFPDARPSPLPRSVCLGTVIVSGLTRGWSRVASANTQASTTQSRDSVSPIGWSHRRARKARPHGADRNPSAGKRAVGNNGASPRGLSSSNLFRFPGIAQQIGSDLVCAADPVV